MLKDDPQITALRLNACEDNQLSEVPRSEVEAHLA